MIPAFRGRLLKVLHLVHRGYEVRYFFMRHPRRREQTLARSFRALNSPAATGRLHLIMFLNLIVKTNALLLLQLFLFLFLLLYYFLVLKAVGLEIFVFLICIATIIVAHRHKFCLIRNFPGNFIYII